MFQYRQKFFKYAKKKKISRNIKKRTASKQTSNQTKQYKNNQTNIIYLYQCSRRHQVIKMDDIHQLSVQMLYLQSIHFIPSNLISSLSEERKWYFENCKSHSSCVASSRIIHIVNRSLRKVLIILAEV